MPLSLSDVRRDSTGAVATATCGPCPEPAAAIDRLRACGVERSMRSLLLLALAPIACTMSSAAPHRDRGQPLTARSSSLIEHGSGCGTQSYLAGRGAPGRAMVAREEADDAPEADA